MPFFKFLKFSYPIFLSSVFFILFCNTALWQELFKLKGGFSVETLVFYLPFFLVLLLLLMVFFSLFRFHYVFKSVLIIFFGAAAAIDYFMQTYGVVIDKSMMQNVWETDVHEATELLTWQMVFHLLIYAGIPSFLLLCTPIDYKPVLRQLLSNFSSAMVYTGLMVGLCYFFYGDYTSLYRNNRQLRYFITPVNLVDASISNLKRKLKSHHALVAIGTDAQLAAKSSPAIKKKLTVLVLGETARAANFSLDGYPRATNPYLSREAVFNFTDVHSCGTATAASVPCMFSMFGREHYDSAKAEYTENVLDVLHHAGVKVLWRNNNEGCKEVCNRIEHEDLAHLKLPQLCNGDECYDEVLLYQLQAYVDKLSSDAVIVLHQKGSHGPDYHLRHPPEFKPFIPECHQALLNDCTREEVINAYDNTIAYTDYFLEKVIAFLKKNSTRYDTAMLYVSDHGESLGENNQYLHGLPYSIAPDEQKHVPFISWFSSDFMKDNHMNTACLHQHENSAYSHDNLFHSLLGLMAVKTQIYKPDLDIFAACKQV